MGCWLSAQIIVEEHISVCGDYYTWNGTMFSMSGDYSYTTTSSTGVDSTTILHLSFLSPEECFEGSPEVLLNINLPNKNGINQVYFSSESDYGYFYENSSIPVFEGEEVYISYSLNSGYKSKTVTLNGVIQNNSGNYLEFVMPSSDVELVIDVEFDPSSPSDPQPADTTKYYNLSLVCNPSTAASVSGEGNYVAGKSIYVSTSANSGYLFTGWSENGEIISTKQSFYYTMPASDAVLTANYVYNPASPTDPEQPKLKHPLSVIASPVGAGTFSTTGSTVTYGEEYYVYAYPNSGYKFKGWIVNGVAQNNESTTLTGVMTEAGASVVGLFVFDPSSPSNPGANYYNPTTGQAIIDDFTPGSLYSAMRNLIGSDNYENVSSLIVKGRLESNDYGYLSYLSNAATIDLSRTGGVTTIPSYAFQNLVAANILLSSEITSIGNYAFSGCANLTSLTLYAFVPPTCSSNTFINFANKANCTVYVPASAIELYSTADYWKDFTLLPITDDAHILQVNLPEEASDGRYKYNSLEIVNITSGVRQKYVISDRLLYTFNGLRKDEQYNIYLYSQAGLEIGRIENVVIPDQDIEVTFDKLKTLHTVSAKVLDVDGNDVTSNVSIEWLKPLADGSISYIRKANSLGLIPEGQKLICRVSLDNTLGVLYHNPKDVEFTVNENENTCSITLLPFRSIALTGTIVDGDGVVLYGASVSVSQVLNGKYNKTFTAKTDRNGAWSVSIFEAPETRLTYTATECINVNDTIGEFDENITTFDLGKVTLKSIVGARISYGFTYHAAGVEEVETYYSDYQNVAISVFNETQNRQHKEVSLQYPTLVILDENVNVGDKLKLTATSKIGAFNSIEQIVTIGDNQRAEVTFDIVGKGGIQASFEMTENPAVIAMLYSSKGEFLKKLTYSETIVKFTELEDGDYTLITMGQSNLMNSILRLSNFAEIGLSEGRDYLKNNIKVESGKLAEIKNTEVPAFDESLFYYTNSSTSFSSNKSSITTGNYLTLRSTIDFKGVYKNDVSNVALVVDLPEACDFVEQSVIQGSNLLPYTLDNNRLTIQLGNDYKSQVRFCVVPTIGGAFNASASVVFDYNGKTITQPIGSATSEIKDLEIIVPSVIAGTTFKVTGTALAKSEVKVYEDGTLLGSGKANGSGSWNIECELTNPYNLSTHSIYAEITTPAGNTLTSETKTLTYDMNALQVSKVTMYHWNPELNGWEGKMEVSEFDFLNPKTTPTQWTVYYPKKVFTYTIEFTDNDPERISNVILYVHTADGRSVPVNASFDETKGMWYAEINMGSSPDGYYPVNCSVDFDCETSIVFDRQEYDNYIADLEFLFEESRNKNILFDQEMSMEETDELITYLIEILNTDDTDVNEIEIALLIDSIIGDVSEVKELTEEEFANIKAASAQAMLEWEELDKSYLENEIIDYVYASSSDSIENLDNNSFVLDYGDKQKQISITTITSINEHQLIEEGYIECILTDNSKIYILMSDSNVCVIDLKKMKKYTIVTSEIGISNSRQRISGEMSGYMNCAKQIIQLVYNLKNISTDRPKALFAVDIVAQITDALSCYYEGLLRHSKDLSINKVKEFITKQQKCLDDECATNVKLKSDLAAKEQKILELSARTSLYRQEIEGIKSNTSLSSIEKDLKIKELENKIGACIDDYDKLDKLRMENLEELADNTSKIWKHEKAVKWSKKALETVKQAYEGCPAKLTRNAKFPKVLKIGGKIAGEFGVFLQVAGFAFNCFDIRDDLIKWCEVINSIDQKFPCTANQFEFSSIKGDVYSTSDEYFWKYLGVMSGDVTTIGFSAAGGIPVVSLTWWLEMVTWGSTEFGRHFVTKGSEENRRVLMQRIKNLNCDKKCGQPGMPKCPDPNPDPDPDPDPNPNPDDDVKIDPSGYVYEAVPENRVEGVQATIYYKETKEDMYGDLYEEVVLWNAEEYAQKNPLFTDENGMYRWDVPQGLWQVKFEKDGYQTTYSEWLPVPPPQLEVNIGIVQNKQPEVIEARAYEEGVEVQFDKFMDLTTLTTDNIYVTANGEKLNGEIRFIDSALADEYASEDDSTATRYASRVRFVPETSLSVTTGEICVTVSRNVLSYAGIPMTATFSQILDVEKEVKEIYADNVKVLYGGEKEITVYAIPFDAAVGRTLHIANSSSLIASVDTTEVVLDNEGKAVVKVMGELPGTTQLNFTIDDVTAIGSCAVDVVTELIEVEAPKASRASGSSVYRGAKIELTTDSKDAVIYFTTDGSCPCDKEGTRRKYTVPIPINEDTKILAITSVGDGDDNISEIVEFNYTLKHSDMEFQLPEGWTWISHNLESAIAPSEFASDEGVVRILSQTHEVVRDPQLGMVGTLTEIVAPKCYKVETTKAPARQRLSDIAWNPATPIALVSGCNWLGYPVSQTMSVDEAFAMTKVETLDVIVGQNGFAQFDGEKWIGTLDVMSPGLGYMYYSQSAKNVVYNTSIVSSAAAKYASGILNNLPFVLDIHKYGQIMPVVATLCNIDDSSLKNENYQIIAFCGSECRGIGRVINGLVMLNVYGNIDDNITFRIFDVSGEKEFTNIASLNFNEIVVGDIFNPYVIEIINSTVTETMDVKYPENIKISVAGNMLKINGINLDNIDLVEVYSVNGMRLLRESNISESGIRLSALVDGIYIVVIDINGEYTYHKIAIR